MMDKKPYGTVLIKASKILDFLSTKEEPANLKEIAESVEMTPSTTLKILDTLQIIGYVSREEKIKGYFLGPALIKYSNKVTDTSILKHVSANALEELQKQIDETIHLGIPTGNEFVYLDKLEPKKQSIYMSSKVGVSRPMYSTGMGKVFLSAFTEEQLEKYFSEITLSAYTEKTITNKFLLEKELEEIRQTGFAYDDEEMEKDCFCVAMPIRNKGTIEGAFSVSMPKFRADSKKVETIIRLMEETQLNIEEELQRF